MGDLLGFLRSNDTHPPLDYLLRMPFASAASDLVLRIPSALSSIAFLLVLARWMRGKGTFGALTTICAAIMPFLVLHGREARMYPLVMLCGVVAAALADGWLHRPSSRAAVGVAAAGLVAMLSHSAALPAVASMFLLPGFRRDRDAWIYRGWIGAAFVAWAGLWGPSFLKQSEAASSPGYWVPHTTPDWVTTVGGALLSARSSLIEVCFVLLLLAIAALLLRRDGVSQVALCAFVVPFVVLVLVGLELRLLLPRSFAFGAWAVAAALGAAVDRMRTVAGPRGAIVGLLLAASLLVPSSVDIVRDGREELVELDVLRDRLEPGDQISIGPDWFRPLLQWNFVAKRGFAVVGDRDGRFVVADRSAPGSGRVHLLDSSGLPLEDVAAGRQPCAAPFEGGSWLLRCVEDRRPAEGSP